MAQRAINIPDLSVESGEGEPLLPPVSSSIGDINGEIQVRAQLPEPRHGEFMQALTGCFPASVVGSSVNRSCDVVLCDLNSATYRNC